MTKFKRSINEKEIISNDCPALRSRAGDVGGADAGEDTQRKQTEIA